MKEATLHEQLTYFLQNKDEEGLLQHLETVTPSDLSHYTSSSLIKLCAYHGMIRAAAKLAQLKSDTDIYEASILGDTEKIKSLAESGVSINAFGDDGHTPLGLACYFSQTEAAKWLCALGADIHVPSKNELGVSPIHAAVAAGNLVITALLLEKGANPNVQQSNGATPLHAAVFSNNLTMTELLIKYNASVSIPMKDGKTPLDLALEHNHAEILRLLKEKDSLY